MTTREVSGSSATWGRHWATCGSASSPRRRSTGTTSSCSWTAAATAVAALLGLRFLASRTEWTAVSPIPLRRRRRVGQILRSAATSIWTSGGEAVALGLGYLPGALIVALVGIVGSYTSAQAVAGLLTVVLLVVTIALVTAYWHLASADHPSPVLGAARLVGRRGGPIGLAVLYSALIVAALTITLVGIP